jgi:transposase InsO family protein
LERHWFKPNGERISRLPDVEGDKPALRKFKRCPIGYFHIDIAEGHTNEGRLYLFVAIDRTSKLAFAALPEKATRRGAGNFLRVLAAAVACKIHRVLADNGAHFADPTGSAWTPEEINALRAENALFRAHAFELACADRDVEHRLTRPRHPWSEEDQETVQWTVSPTNGQVERMSRTIKEATVKRFHHDSHDQLREHLADFVAAHNFARRLKTLKGLTPYEHICKI